MSSVSLGSSDLVLLDGIGDPDPDSFADTIATSDGVESMSAVHGLFSVRLSELEDLLQTSEATILKQSGELHELHLLRTHDLESMRLLNVSLAEQKQWLATEASQHRVTKRELQEMTVKCAQAEDSARTWESTAEEFQEGLRFSQLREGKLRRELDGLQSPESSDVKEHVPPCTWRSILQIINVIPYIGLRDGLRELRACYFRTDSKQRRSLASSGPQSGG